MPPFPLALYLLPPSTWSRLVAGAERERERGMQWCDLGTWGQEIIQRPPCPVTAMRQSRREEQQPIILLTGNTISYLLMLHTEICIIVMS